jgi:hypothetical protein
VCTEEERCRTVKVTSLKVKRIVLVKSLGPDKAKSVGGGSILKHREPVNASYGNKNTAVMASWLFEIRNKMKRHREAYSA